MDYMMAYGSLRELFPLVDSRILKAVAIEHPNDGNAAVEFILYEVLPSLSGPSDATYSVHDTCEVTNEVQLRKHNANDHGAEAPQSESIICRAAISDESAGFMSPFSGVVEENIIDVERLEASNYYSSLSILGEHPDADGYDSLVKDINRSVSEVEEQLSMFSDEYAGTIVSVAYESANEIPSSVNEKSMDSMERGDELPKDIHGAFGENEDHSKNLVENRSEQLVRAEVNQVIYIEEDDIPMIQSTRSGHMINIDLLEDCVKDAKSNKKVLVSAVELVVDMMREAEILEERAKQAKEEASSAGQDILMKVEELKQMLQHANKANDMHAGEVYGEKAILSTEARELQARLLNLSDERNKSFSVIEEIRGTLEARLAAAKDEIERAEQEKLEKERLAKEVLKEQEAFMELVVQESKRLQQEAEANAQLREFLVDRGRVLDTLQGVIAVICEDVLLLKKRVDERAPLKGSLLMSTYSTASTSSTFSHKSTPSAEGQGLLPVELRENSRESSEDHGSSHEQEHEKIITVSGSEEASMSSRQKSASDEDWEFLNHDACPF